MVTRLETISADAPIADLVPLFRKDYVAIVMDGDQFLGLATRLDLINYFRIARDEPMTRTSSTSPPAACMPGRRPIRPPAR